MTLETPSSHKDLNTRLSQLKGQSLLFYKSVKTLLASRASKLLNWYKNRFRSSTGKFLGVALLLTVPALILVTILFVHELRTSGWQARYFSKIAHEATFTVKDGASKSISFPSFGPYDQRLGYTAIKSISEALTNAGYTISKQVNQSARFLSLVQSGLYPPYKEKSRTGITILDRNNTTIYSAYRPSRIYESFESIPNTLVKSLLFIENREILDQKHEKKNPAVEWDRFAKALLEKIWQIFSPDINAPGGSTIATQLEKYRHSKGGRTGGVRDKLLQMISASLRAYMHGESTVDTRKEIVLDYVNSIPLAALPGYGEVNGLGDGLWAWFGLDFDSANASLTQLTKESGSSSPELAATFKQALSLFIAHRRPSFYLLNGLEELNQLTNIHLDMLVAEGIISSPLAEAAKKVSLVLRRALPKPSPTSFIQMKTANAIRTRLLSLTGLLQLYDLDQLDLTVKSTLDNQSSVSVTNVLRQIKTSADVKKFGLNGARNLSRGDPSKVIYSLTLYESVGNANVLRVQTDNFDKPFSINEGTRLDLGSTAKLRTVTTYLDIVAKLHEKLSPEKPADLKELVRSSPDPLTLFVAQELLNSPQPSLVQLLEKAMERRYSASAAERFFTGGGVHTFKNFRREDDGRIPTVQEALTESINLPMVRLMRDIVKYYSYRLGDGELGALNTKTDLALRQRFLEKFADQEGTHFLRTFAKKYTDQKPSEMLRALVKNSRSSVQHAAAMYRYVRPEGSVEQLAEFLSTSIKSSNVSLPLVEKWHREYAPGKFSLNDQGYVARIHPLELWLVKFLQDNPGASTSSAIEASKGERQEVYQWLFKTSHVKAQDIRIRSLIEVEAFLELHKQWKKMGYPFNSMVPSLASSIGSSGDRPTALAELVGIILNKGVKKPLVRLDTIHFAPTTPYETVLTRDDSKVGEQVLKKEVAGRLMHAMLQVVEHGTARRVFSTFVRSDGKPYSIGGKTGTGDHRHETFGPGGSLVSSRVVNRTATFCFFLGDRFFGVISAHVPGAEAAKFDFTSALAAELLKYLSKSLIQMIESSGAALAPEGIEPPPVKAQEKVKGK